MTSVYPYIAVARDVIVQNATGEDLEVHSSDVGTDYFIIGAGYERNMAGNWPLYQRNQIGFWLRSAVGGTVVVIWIP